MTRLPASIGRYDVIERISFVAMGEVYKALDTALGDSVVIQVMTGFCGAGRDALEPFYRQAALGAQLQHPNVLAVRDISQHDGIPYMVMEYVDGEALDVIIKSGRLIPVPEKIGYIIEVCRALSYVHGKGIVHRNIKSANIMILKSGGVKIFDFSMAVIEAEQVRGPLRVGQIAGILTHMSPEQIRGEVVDARSDIFSTGVVLYQLLTGFLPFQGLSSVEVIMGIINDRPRPFTDSFGRHSARLQEITFRALAKDREQRYQTAEGLGFDLSEVREQIAA